MHNWHMYGAGSALGYGYELAAVRFRARFDPVGWGLLIDSKPKSKPKPESKPTLKPK